MRGVLWYTIIGKFLTNYAPKSSLGSKEERVQKTERDDVLIILFIKQNFSC